MSKLYTVGAGASLMDELLDIARRERIETASVEGIGAVSKLRIAYYNQLSKKYEEHDYDEFLEVTSLLGNITQKDGEPFLHLHGNFGGQDMSVVGGHIVSATVSPIIEVVIAPTANKALRRFDEDWGLNLIAQDEE